MPCEERENTIHLEEPIWVVALLKVSVDTMVVKNLGQFTLTACEIRG